MLILYFSLQLSIIHSIIYNFSRSGYLANLSYIFTHILLVSVDALMCIWTVSEPSVTMCYERPGYTFDGKISRTLTIHIPAANQSHEGHYFCDVSPTRIGVARPVCNVTVIGMSLPGREKSVCLLVACLLA